MKPISVLDLPVPRNKTALMQQLQLLVGREQHRHWCGGVIARDKLAGFAEKMAARYPVTRSTRQRSYDRSRGRATVHLLTFPLDDTHVAWWLLSSAGSGGLADPSSPDAHVAFDAMSRDGHLTLDDYVLLFAHKREPREIRDGQTGCVKTVEKDLSTWTWKLRREVIRELEAGVEACCRELAYGDEGGPGRKSWGLRGLLACQRSRPLFSGVRTQVLALHRLANERWQRVRPQWLLRHAQLSQRYGALAGALRPLNDVTRQHLPKMVRIRVFDTPPATLRSLCRGTARQ